MRARKSVRVCPLSRLSSVWVTPRSSRATTVRATAFRSRSWCEGELICGSAVRFMQQNAFPRLLQAGAGDDIAREKWCVGDFPRLGEFPDDEQLALEDAGGGIGNECRRGSECGRQFGHADVRASDPSVAGRRGFGS